jgi:hypothetical protein
MNPQELEREREKQRQKLEEWRKNNPRRKKADPQDIRLATILLLGGDPDDKNITRLKYPSRNTKPTEKEARAALARVLMSVDPPRMILWYVAGLFDREAADVEGLVHRRVDFKNLNQGHHDPVRNFTIAELVERLRDGRSYKEATEEAAKRLGKTPRTVQRIYAKWFPKQYRKEKRSFWKERRSSDTSS